MNFYAICLETRKVKNLGTFNNIVELINEYKQYHFFRNGAEENLANFNDGVYLVSHDINKIAAELKNLAIGV